MTMKLYIHNLYKRGLDIEQTLKQIPIENHMSLNIKTIWVYIVNSDNTKILQGMGLQYFYKRI